MAAVSVQLVDDVVLFDPGSMSRSDTSENSFDDIESGVERDKRSYDMRARSAKFTEVIGSGITTQGYTWDGLRIGSEITRVIFG